jgi:hypothetical protein
VPVIQISALTLNSNNDLVVLAAHHENAEIAQNTTPNLTKEDAEKIAKQFIYTKHSPNDLGNIPTATATLTVWQNCLVWSLQIDGIKFGSSTLGYSFYIDALNGQIKFQDSYFALGRE